MTKTLVDLDEELVETAMRELGLRTKKETITVALQHVVDSSIERRRQAGDRLYELLEADDVNWDALKAADE